jgi:hypothetical protein
MNQLTKCAIFPSPVSSSLLGTSILSSTLFSNVLNLCHCVMLRDQLSHPFWTISMIIVSYDSIFTSLWIWEGRQMILNWMVPIISRIQYCIHTQCSLGPATGFGGETRERRSGRRNSPFLRSRSVCSSRTSVSEEHLMDRSVCICLEFPKK